MVIEHGSFIGNRGNEDCEVRNCLIAHNDDAEMVVVYSRGARGFELE
jgi:hypothetical protein